MPAIANKQDFVDYILRKLGFPVLEINVTEEQIDDVVHDGLKFMQEFHEDFYERTYVKHIITASHIILSSNSASMFAKGETITGNTSGAKLVVHDAMDNKVRAQTIAGNYIAGESVTGSISNFSTSLALVDFQFIGDTQNQSIPLEDDTLEVLRVVTLGSSYSGTDYAYNPQYQFALSTMFNLNNSNQIYYEMAQQNISLLDFQFGRMPAVSFKRATGVVKVYDNRLSGYCADETLIFEVFKKLDPDLYVKLYDDKMFKKLITAMLKYQWGQNLSKFDGVKLPGGITLNGVQMKAEAAAEVAQIQEEIRDAYEGPAEFIVG